MHPRLWPRLSLKALSHWLPPLAWSLVIIGFSGELGSAQQTLGIIRGLLELIPGLTPDQMMWLHGLTRKAGNLLGYALLAFLWLRLLAGHLRLRRGRAAAVALGLCLAIALIDEGHQTQLDSLTGSLWDVALDMTGAILAAGLTLSRRRPRH